MLRRFAGTYRICRAVRQPRSRDTLAGFIEVVTAEFCYLDTLTQGLWIAIAAIALVATASMLRAARRRRDCRLAAELWSQAAPSDRRRLLNDFIDLRPETAAAHYLYGCACLRDEDVSAAARAFGAAYHADYRLESAALLTFACLKTSADEGGMGTLRHHVLTTWDEMKRHPLAANSMEQGVIETLNAPDSAAGSRLAERAPGHGRAPDSGSRLDAARLLDRILALPDPAAARKNSP